MLIQPLRSGNENLTPYGLLLEDVRVGSNSFTHLCYSYIKREGNKVLTVWLDLLLMFQNFLCG